MFGITPPVLPDTFIATFTNPPGPMQPLTGTWYYDFKNQLQRVDGGNQASCNAISNTGEYCTTYLTSSNFYVVFPFSKKCVKSSSPGLVSPKWLINDNATLAGTEMINGRVCNVWVAYGSSKNAWLQDGFGFPCRLDDGGFNWTFSSFQHIAFDPTIVQVPEYCD